MAMGSLLRRCAKVHAYSDRDDVRVVSVVGPGIDVLDGVPQGCFWDFFGICAPFV